MLFDFELLQELASAAETDGRELLVNGREPKEWEAEIVVETAAGDPTRIVRLVGHMRGTSDSITHGELQDPADMLRRVLRHLEPDARRVARASARRVTVGVESVVGQARIALDAENSRLRAELAAARIEIDFLRNALQSLGEASATGRKGILRGALGFVASVFFAVASGAAGGVAGGLVVGSPDVVVEVNAPPSEVSAIELLRQCEKLLVDVEALPERVPAVA